MSDTESKLFRKIAQVITLVERVEKDGHNDHFNYDYTSAETILAAIRGPLAELNVALFPSLTSIEERPYKTSGGKESVITTAHMDFTFVDGETGEMFKCSWAGQGDDPADKGWGKAATNAIKTFLRQTFLLPQGDDPEADTSTDQRAQERVSSGSRRQSSGAPKPSPKQLKLLHDLITRKKPTVMQLRIMLKDAGAPSDMEIAEGWAEKLTGGKEGQVSALIDRLMNGTLPEVKSLETPASDVPDKDAPAHEPAGDDSDVPFSEAA